MKTTNVNMKKMRKVKEDKKSGLYEIIDNGKDAIIKFGKMRGMAISDIAITDEWYLKWFIEQTDFGVEIKKIAGMHSGYAETEIF